MQLLAQGQPILAQPQLAAAPHGGIDRRRRQVHTGGQLALAGKTRLHLFAQVGGEARPIDIEGVASESHAQARLLSDLAHIAGGFEEGQPVAFGGEGSVEIADRLPGAVRAALEHKPLPILHAHAQNAAARGCPAGRCCAAQRPAGLLPPQGQLHAPGVQVILPFHVQALSLAAAAHVFQAGQRGRGLGDIGLEVVLSQFLDALPGGLGCGLGRLPGEDAAPPGQEAQAKQQRSNGQQQNCAARCSNATIRGKWIFHDCSPVEPARIA